MVNYVFQGPVVRPAVRQPAQGGPVRQHPGLCARLRVPQGVRTRFLVLWIE